MRAAAVCAGITLFMFSANLSAQERRWSAREGTTIITLDDAKMSALGLVSSGVRVTDTSEIKNGLPFVVDLRSDLVFRTQAGAYAGVVSGAIQHRGKLVLSVGAKLARLVDFTAVPKGDKFELFNGGDSALSSPVLSYSAANALWSKETSFLTVGSTDLQLTQTGAELLGIPDGAGKAIGKIVVRLWAADASEPRPAEAASAVTAEPTTRVPSDLTFCQLYGLTELGRVGNTAGLGVGTTSWNIGNARLDWFPSPDAKHPFIVTNIYRVSDQRFEQIGVSWAKHGFFALSNSQCQPNSCTENTDGTQLGVGCTDTYSPGTNADQGSLGPRFEVNPWEGTWTSSQLWKPAHNEIQHRLLVQDDDLDTAKHPGATYLVEGYYVHYQDSDVTNSAAWKRFTSTWSAAAKKWTFTMTGAATRPAIGFAIDGWPGARRVVLAQTVPPVKWQSPDGRCVLASKVQDLGGGVWHYEYALLNVDMDRQVSSFSIILPAGAKVSKAGFAAPQHEEPFNGVGGVAIDNSAWDFSADGGSATWQTSKNPLRWGTVYSFWFDANKGPGDAGVTLGLFKPGAPSSVSGVSAGPVQ